MTQTIETSRNEADKSNVRHKTKGSDDHCDINLDERYIEASKALNNGDLTKYGELSRSIKRFPRGTIDPADANQKLQHSEGDMPDGDITVLDPEENILRDNSDHL